MKRNVIPVTSMILLIVFAVLTSCVSSQSFLPVKGSGMSVDKNYNVSDFHGIDVSGGFDVVLVQGNSEGLTLTSQENLFEYITVKVDQGILRIYTEGNIISTKPMKVRVLFKSISNIEVSGGGDVICETPVNVPELGVEISGGGDLSGVINTDALKGHITGGGDVRVDGSFKEYAIDLSGGGDVRSEADAGIISCTISGGGDLTIRSKKPVTDATIDINGGGDVEAVMNAEKMKCSVSGGGNASLTGQATTLEININGGGDVNAGGFSAVTAVVRASGGSDIHVNVSKELSGYVTGGGDVYYSGNPEMVSLDAKGGSEIHKE